MTGGPHWMPVALRELGVREQPGDLDAPRIVAYHQATALHATQDETPWCSSFVNFVLSVAHVPITRSAMARSWLAWGMSTSERYGAVTILARGTRPLQGHVGFLIDADADWLWLLGGNQADAVSVARYARATLLGLRWPVGG